MRAESKKQKAESRVGEEQSAIRNIHHSSLITHHSSLFFYNLLLTALAIPALPFAGLALLVRPRYRLGLAQRLGFLPDEVKQCVHNRRPLWLHAPSVGEMLATQPFLRTLKQAFPDKPVLLSMQTPTAYATAQTKIPEADAAMYFPLDHPLLIRRVLRQVKPAAFFFTETEMWPNCLSTLAREGVPTFLVSGRFSRRARARYRLLHPFFRPVFQNLTLCCMQTRDDAERLIEAGTPRERVIVTGNFKVDGVNEGGDQGQAILQTAGLADRLLLVGASTHPSEETVLLHVYRRLRTAVPNLLLLLAPRHPQRFTEVEAMLKTGGYRYVKRSQSSEASVTEVEVFLLDTLGELSSFYRTAALAFVGGSLVKGPGGHSVIEPALAQVPVCFGPYTRNFTTVVEELTRAGGGFEVRDEEDFYQQTLPLLTNAHARLEAGRRAYEVIKRGQGAVERTLAAVLERLQAVSSQQKKNGTTGLGEINSRR
jgi:3-deoxy-D-manno-octulosonic-acid transferase